VSEVFAASFKQKKAGFGWLYAVRKASTPQTFARFICRIPLRFGIFFLYQTLVFRFLEFCLRGRSEE